MSASSRPAGVGRGLFWASLLAFVAVDAALLARVQRLAQSAPQLLAFALIAAFALALAYATAVASVAVGRRRAPPLRDALRAGLLIALAAGHLALIARAHLG